jgi:hypothetical protein
MNWPNAGFIFFRRVSILSPTKENFQIVNTQLFMYIATFFLPDTTYILIPHALQA